MKSNRLCFNRIFPIFTLYLFVICLLLTITHTTQAQVNGNGNNSGERSIHIDFNNVDISTFIKFMSEYTGKNYIIDNRVKGKVTIISPTKITEDELYEVFESVLEVYGFATVESGNVVKIITSPEARTKSIETLLKQEAVSPEDKVVTQLIPLRYADPNEIKRLLAPLVSKSSLILSYDPTNMLIVTDVYSNIQRLMKILKTVDVEGVGQEISVIQVEYADATKLVKTLGTVFRPQRRAGKKVSPDDVPQMVADERTNMIVLMASEDDTPKIKRLISLLDKEMPRGNENIHVYYLENATAEDLAKVLQSLSSKPKPTTPGKKEAPIVSESVQITADKATNSLIMMADKDDYLVLEDIIKKLDVPRLMVYIECLIMEVNVDKGFSLGAEWMAAGKTDFDTREGVFGGGFSGSDTPYGTLGNLMPQAQISSNGAISAASGGFPSGFSLGVFTEQLQIGNVVFPNLGAIVQAYRKDKNVHILSTPQILTTDNQEASITVGKNVPYQTKAGTLSTSETYNTYEYKDVGITLKITPQISKDRMIRLKIFQEVTKLDSVPTAGTDERPTTLKRSIDTTVIVNDKNTIAIGGLIDDSFSNTEYKIPCLGDTPGVGWLFKNLSRSREKTNLFVFLTPHVVETSEEAEQLYRDKKEMLDQMDEENLEGIKLYKKGKDTEPKEPVLIN